MEVIVLGTGCGKCKATYAAVKKVIDENGLDIALSKQEDIMEIMKYNVMTLPAIVVDGEVRIKGHIPSEGEICKLLGV
ncbi:thioredoxin family protein [Parabacteroides sp. OttesenSCG-928-G07]|nr:thioredoxin family protein [Parabacteroides sp. OttesenSCG-928-G07]